MTSWSYLSVPRARQHVPPGLAFSGVEFERVAGLVEHLRQHGPEHSDAGQALEQHVQDVLLKVVEAVRALGLVVTSRLRGREILLNPVELGPMLALNVLDLDS